MCAEFMQVTDNDAVCMKVGRDLEVCRGTKIEIIWAIHRWEVLVDLLIY